MKTEELKPCPFCGSVSVEPVRVGLSRIIFYAVMCYECHSYGPTSTKEDNAIDNWNIRVTKPEPGKGWE